MLKGNVFNFSNPLPWVLLSSGTLDLPMISKAYGFNFSNFSNFFNFFFNFSNFFLPFLSFAPSASPEP